MARAIDYWLDHPEEKARMEEQYRQFGRQYSLASSVAKFEQMLDAEMQEQRNVASQLPTPIVKPRSRSLLRRVAALWSMLTFVCLSLLAQEKVEYLPYWQNNHRLSIRYGDITGSTDYKSWEKLSKNRFMARNSKGKMVPIQEVGYRADMTPTHLILQISSGCQEPYTGCTGNVVWVDNVRLVY